MDFDATQAILCSDEESDAEQETGQRRQVAVLKVLAQRDLPETQQAIFEGENFIGRHDSNSVHLPYKALSKQHACIEVEGNTHLLYDLGSRNRTRRGKMFLKPSVRYELKDNDMLIFGDVKCQYMFYSEDVQEADDSGSETDSELMFHLPDSETTYNESSQDENDSSFNISDVLQPTQAALDSPKLQFKTPKRVSSGRVFAAESDDESPNKSIARKEGDTSFIPDTQLSAKKKGSVTFVEESDSDTDIETGDTAPFNVSDIAAAPTQAVENMATQVIDNMATQAIDNMATQVIDNMATQALDNMATQALDNMATQAIDNMETQATDSLSSDVALDNAATLAIENAATLAIASDEYGQDSESSDVGEETGPTLLLEASSASSDLEKTPAKQAIDPKTLFEEPTQPCLGFVSDSDSDTDIDEVEVEAETQAVKANASHLSNLDDMATIPITTEDDDTDDEVNAAAPDSKENISNMATAPMATDDDITDEEDQVVEQAEDKTLLDIENMATVPMAMESDSDTDISDEGGVDHMSAVQETQALDDGDVREQIDVNDNNDKGSQPDKPASGTTRVEVSKDSGDVRQREEGWDIGNVSTQPYGTSSGDQWEDHGNDNIEATQPYGDEEAPCPMEMDATQPYGGSLSPPPEKHEADSEVAMEMEDSEVEATQAYGEQGNDTQVPDSQEDSIASDISSRFPLLSNQSPSVLSLKSSAKSPASTAKAPSKSPVVSPSRSTAMSPTMSPTKSCLKQADKPVKQTVQGRKVTFESPEDADDQMEETPQEKTTSRRHSRQPPDRDESKLSSNVKPPASSGRKSVQKKQIQASNQNDKSEDISEQRTSGRRSARRGHEESSDDKSKVAEKSNGQQVSKVGTTRQGSCRRGEKESRSSSQNADSEMGRGKRTRGNKGTVETDAAPTRRRSLVEEKSPTSTRQLNSKKETEQDMKQNESSTVTTAKAGEKDKEKGKLKQTLITSIGTRRKSKVEDAIVTSKDETEGPRTRRSKRVKTREAEVDANDSDETASLSSTASSIKDLTEVDSAGGTDLRLSTAERESPDTSRSMRSSRRSTRKVDTDFVYETPRAARNRNEKTKEEVKPNERTKVAKVQISKQTVSADVGSSRKDRRGVGKDSESKTETREQTPASGTRRSRRGTTESQEDSGQAKTENRQSVRQHEQDTKAKEKDSQSQDEVTPPAVGQRATQQEEDNTFAVPKPVTRTARQKKIQESFSVEKPGRKETRSGASSGDSQKEAETESQSERASRGRRSTTTAKAATSKKEEVSVTDSGRADEKAKKGKKNAAPEKVEPEATEMRGARASRREQKDEKARSHLAEQENKTRNKRHAAEAPPASPAKKSRQSTPSLAHAATPPRPSSSPRQTRERPETAGFSPSLRKRGSEVKPKVMFTGVTDESWRKTVTSLGGELVDSVFDCTHLITDKVRRTVKFLCCLAQGAIIVTPDWLGKSNSSKVFVDPAPFQLRDRAAEKQHGFSLGASLQKAGQGRLFRGYHIHVTPGVRPEPAHMKDIVRCAGGQYVNKLPSKSSGPQTVVVSCDGDKSAWSGAAKGGLPVVSSEFILTGILKQEILIEQYRLK